MYNVFKTAQSTHGASAPWRGNPCVESVLDKVLTRRKRTKRTWGWGEKRARPGSRTGLEMEIDEWSGFGFKGESGPNFNIIPTSPNPESKYRPTFTFEQVQRESGPSYLTSSPKESTRPVLSIRLSF